MLGEQQLARLASSRPMALGGVVVVVLTDALHSSVVWRARAFCAFATRPAM